MEISCPETCEYLKAGREHEAEDYAKRIRSMDRATQEKNKKVLLDYQNVVARLEYVLSRERILSRDLTDKDVAQAIAILLDTYRTEDNGILYEKTSDDLRVESLRRELRKIVESFRNPEGTQGKGIVDPQSARLPLSAAIDCLEFIRSLVMAYQDNRHSASRYVDFLARVMPKNEERSSIILP